MKCEVCGLKRIKRKRILVLGEYKYICEECWRKAR